jgi:hypothetical protein
MTLEAAAMARNAGSDRLEEILERLAEAQRRTEMRIGQLTEAQARTEAALQQTQEGLRQMARQVGDLSDAVGGDIEDIAYIVLHDVLTREFGWEVGVLERTWEPWEGEEAPDRHSVFPCVALVKGGSAVELIYPYQAI